MRPEFRMFLDALNQASRGEETYNGSAPTGRDLVWYGDIPEEAQELFGLLPGQRKQHLNWGNIAIEIRPRYGFKEKK